MKGKQFKFIIISSFLLAICVAVAIGAQTKSKSKKGKETKATKAAGEGLLERALKGQAQIIDLTHLISEKTPTFGGERDAFKYETLSDSKKDGYASGAI